MRFSSNDQASFLRAFKNYDKDNSGTIETNEFKSIMIDLGFRKVSDQEIDNLFR